MDEENHTSIDGGARLPAMDGLRGLSCLLVLWCHSCEIQLLAYNPFAGIYGVKLFFTLSGFLMGMHYLPGEASWRYWAGFWVRRFLRIYPAYAVAMLTFWALFQFGINMPLFGGFNTAQLMRQLTLQGGIMTYWSILLELKFYAIFPLICLPFLIGPPRRRALPALMLAALWALMFWFIDDSRVNTILWEKMPCFLGGVMLALLWRRVRLSWAASPLWNGLFWIGLALMLAGIQYGYFPALASLRNDRVMTLICMLLALAASLVTGRTHAVLAGRALTFVGRISYSLYVTHRIVFGVSVLALPLNPGMSAAIAITEFAVAYALYRLVEKPFMLLGRRLAQRVAQARLALRPAVS